MKSQTTSAERTSARMRAADRLRLRAARMQDASEAAVYGLGLSELSSPSLPPGVDADAGGVILVKKTTTGNWSTDGNDTAPTVGPWLYLKRSSATADVPAESVGGAEPVGTVSQSTVKWSVELWDDGDKDTGFLWESEDLASSLAGDIFDFEVWQKVSGTGSGLWIVPVESGGGGGGEPGPPGASITTVVLTLAQYLALSVEEQEDPTKWYVIPTD